MKLVNTYNRNSLFTFSCCIKSNRPHSGCCSLIFDGQFCRGHSSRGQSVRGQIPWRAWDFDPLPGQCWATVADGVPALTRQRASVSSREPIPWLSAITPRWEKGGKITTGDKWMWKWRGVPSHNPPPPSPPFPRGGSGTIYPCVPQNAWWCAHYITHSMHIFTPTYFLYRIIMII